MHGETFLCIANRAWDSLWGESQKIMVRIARQNRVLYFEPGRSVNRSMGAEFRRNLPNFFRFRAKEVAENLVVIPTPPNLPVGRQFLPGRFLRITTPLGAELNNRIIARHVRLAMNKFVVKDPILWLYSPYQHGLVGQFGEKLSCYHNYDEFSDFLTNARIKNLLKNFDDRLTAAVDVVFATSRAQWEKRRRLNPNTYFVPNGVDFELFNQAMEPTLPEPEDFAHLPRPIIGFAGMLGFHIDVELLLKIAKAYPNYSVVLVGPDNLPDTPAYHELREAANVHFLGFKPMNELPRYIRFFDVALIPYQLVGHVLSGYPQKLHEYLAGGKAIVASNMPELQPYSQFVRIAENHEQFVYLIGEALDDYAPHTISARVQVASENTWDQRVKVMYEILEVRLSPSIAEKLT